MEFIDKSQIMQGIQPDSTADVLEKGMNHKYYKREGTPGNYKYYYTEEEYKKAKPQEKSFDKDPISKYREELINHGTKNGDKALVEYAKTASSKQIEQRMKSDKYEEQFQDKTPEKKEEHHDSRFKFRKGATVSFTHKGETIQGTIVDYDYNQVTFKKEYSIDYKKDGKTWTMIGVTEDKIQEQVKGGSKDTKKDVHFKKLSSEVKAELNKIGFNENSRQYKNASVMLNNLQEVEVKLSKNSKEVDRFGIKTDVEVGRSGEALGVILFNMDGIRREFREAWEKEKRENRHSNFYLFAAERASEIGNRILGTKFSSNNYLQSGNFVGFYIR